MADDANKLSNGMIHNFAQTLNGTPSISTHVDLRRISTMTIFQPPVTLDHDAACNVRALVIVVTNDDRESRVLV